MVNIKTVSQLHETSFLQDNDFFGVSHPIKYDLLSNANGQPIPIYGSNKVSMKTLGDAMISKVSSFYAAEPFNLSDGIDIGELHYDFYDCFKNGEFTVEGNTTFENAPKIKETLSNFFDEDSDKDKKAVNLETLKRYSNSAVSPAIGNSFGFVTVVNTDSSDQNKNSAAYNLFKIGSDNKIDGSFNWGLTPDAKTFAEHEYVFHIDPHKKESNEWVAPATGMFTCYGWLDELQTEKVSNESRWVALLGYKDFSDGGRWVILQLQPFIPNNFLSYVGFNFPVQAGMRLKVRTGFTTGSNSDKYFYSSSSIANHVVNGFLGGIYTNLSVGEYANISFKNTANNTLEFLSSRVLSLTMSAESNISIDATQKSDISELSTKLSTLENFDGASKEDLSAISSSLSDLIKEVDDKNVDYFDSTISNSLRVAAVYYGNGKAYGVDNVDQQYGFSAGDKKRAMKISWNKSKSVFDNIQDNLGQRYYYAPPVFSETIRDGEYADRLGNVERAYLNLRNIPNGTIFSDGLYYYYVTSQDSTVRISLPEDTINYGGEYKFCYMLYNIKGNFNETKYVNLIDNTEHGSGHAFSTSITVPAKAGTIFVFGLYMRQKCDPTTPAKYSWVEYINRPNFIYARQNTGNFSELFTSKFASCDGNNMYLKFDANGNLSYYSLKTIRLNADGSNFGELFSDTDNSKYSASNVSFSQIANIVELP